jgi:hypothetical protein
MRWYLVIVCLVSITLTETTAKNLRKNHGMKKATSLKPTKHPKTIVDLFREYPADDREFIRQLDKQFAKFGDNIKIKVEKENGTTSKNTKRTIDGSLGYGYYTNQNNNGYYFSKPNYQLYPYSQNDIPAANGYQTQTDHGHYAHGNAHHHDYLQPQRLHTTVEIQRSHGYEIKPEDTEYRTIFEEDEYQQYLQRQREYQHHQQSQSGYDGHDGPVIVLRVPGPAKYAAHLQALLQQYLELRAAQYIQALQEQEAQSHHAPHSQHYSEPDLLSPYHQHDQNTHKYSQPIYGSELFQANHEDQSGQVQADEPEHGHHHQSLHEAPIVYQHEGDVDEEQQYQTRYAYQSDEKHAVTAHQAPHGYAYDQPSHNPSPAHLLTSENFPDNKHTQVIFKSTTQHPQEYHHLHDHHHQLQEHAAHVALTSQAADHAVADGDDTTATDAVDSNAQVQTYNAPLVYHQLEQYYGDEEEFLPSSGEPHGYLPTADHASQVVQQPTEQNYVTITQRPPHEAPYNYHAHPLQQDETGALYATSVPSRLRSTKRQAHFTEEQMKKFNALMERMKKKLTATHQSDETASDANEKR